MRIAAVIPARLASTRFPGKMLYPIAGKPLLQWVYEGVAACPQLALVQIATDDPHIAASAQRFGAEAILTDPKHPSGTDRVAEVARKLDADWIVNVQGDEPLIDPHALGPLLDALAAQSPEIGIVTLARRAQASDDLSDRNLVKVVFSLAGRALYFSRLPIPCDRDRIGLAEHWIHIGIYAYRKQTLQQLVALPPAPLEQAEKLEQLRALQNGIAIQVLPTNVTLVGVDTPEDVRRVEPLLQTRAPSLRPV